MQTKTAFDQRIQAIHTLRVNVKSLAHEARIIRQETRRAGKDYRNALAQHRRTTVREEARATQLALAFVRGRRYRTVEAKSVDSKFERLDLVESVVRKVRRHFGSQYGADVVKWLNEGL